MSSDLLQDLMDWFKSNCDGDWEHGYGIKIETLDNPGWEVDIDLTYTDMKNAVFDNIVVDNGDDDWYFCMVEDNVFKGRGDAGKLNTLLRAFFDWVKC